MIDLKSTKIISLTSLKGGTGKTLITFNLAVLLAKKYKKKILVIDLDAQHNMTNLFTGPVNRNKFKLSDRPTEEMIRGKVYTSEDIFENNISAMGLIHKTRYRNIDIIPTTLEMTATELKVSGMSGREFILKNWIYDNKDSLKDYDYIFFDTNPTMSTVNINAYIVCDDIVLITDVDADSLNAVNTFLELYYPIQFRLDRQMEDNVNALIANKIQKGRNLDTDFIELVESDNFMYRDIMLKTKIHDATALAKTKVDREAIEKKDNERAYSEFISIIEELMKKGIL